MAEVSTATVQLQQQYSEAVILTCTYKEDCTSNICLKVNQQLLNLKQMLVIGCTEEACSVRTKLQDRYKEQQKNT